MKANLLAASRPINNAAGQYVFRSDMVEKCIPGAKATNKWASAAICRKEDEENGQRKK